MIGFRFVPVAVNQVWAAEADLTNFICTQHVALGIEASHFKECTELMQLVQVGLTQVLWGNG